MAFISDTSGVISFADFSDVYNRDQRIFDSNEGLTDEVIESHCIRATERILSKIRSTAWWSTVNQVQTTEIPVINPNQIISRLNDFTDLCVYTALSEYTLPLIANFGMDETDERQKMKYYTVRADELLREIIQVGDWYDFNNDLSISSDEIHPTLLNLRRIR